MFDMYQLPEKMASGGYLDLIKRELDGLHGQRYDKAHELGRRIGELFHTPTRDVNQERLLISALLRTIDALHSVAAEAITGRVVLPQSEEAAMVRLYMKTAALHSILERTLAGARPACRWANSGSR
jgi:hypothetical protein